MPSPRGNLSRQPGSRASCAWYRVFLTEGPRKPITSARQNVTTAGTSLRSKSSNAVIPRPVQSPVNTRMPRPFEKEKAMRQTTDQTVIRTIAYVKEAAPRAKLEGVSSYIWYDVTDQGLAAEVTLLRHAGVIAHHPVVHTLIRFDD